MLRLYVGSMVLSPVATNKGKSIAAEQVGTLTLLWLQETGSLILTLNFGKDGEPAGSDNRG
jgi:hypothetical protein